MMVTALEEKSTIEEIRQRFDEDVERFSDFQAGQQTIVDAKLLMGLIAQTAAICNPKAETVLEIGCGTGNNTLKLLEFINPLDCDLVDLSRPMLDHALERIAATNSGQTRAFQSDFREVELPEGHYDIILAAAVLHHLRDDADWEHVFSKIYKITAPGGSVWISDLVSHETSAVQTVMWQRYGEYLEALGGLELKDKVFSCINREDSPRSVTYQLDLLRKVGFSAVDILHKNTCFVAFGAKKNCL